MLPCPDCDVELQLVDDAETGIGAVLIESSESAGSTAKTHSTLADGALGTRVIECVHSTATLAAPVWKLIATPVGIGWSVAGTVGAVLLGSLIFSGDSTDLPSPNAQQLPISLNDGNTDDGNTDNDNTGSGNTGSGSAVTAGSTDSDSELANRSENKTPLAIDEDANPGDAGLDSVPLINAVDGPRPDETTAGVSPTPSVTTKSDSVTPSDESPTLPTAIEKLPETPPATATLKPTTNPKPTANPKPAVVAAVLAKPKQPVIDVKAALAQSIREYRLSNRVPLKSVLVELEEMAGVPISIDSQRIRAAGLRLDEPISLSLRSTTVGEILKTALGLAQLSFKTDDAGILVIPAPAPAPVATDRE